MKNIVHETFWAINIRKEKTDLLLPICYWYSGIFHLV